MNLKRTFYTALYTALALLFPLLSSAQQEDIEWIGTEAIIKNIEKKGVGKKTREIATISFTTQQGNTIKARVHLLRIPFLGTFRAPGDKINIKYQKDKPVLVETTIGWYISKYGMYILIGLGLLLSTQVLKQIKKKIP